MISKSSSTNRLRVGFAMVFALALSACLGRPDAPPPNNPVTASRPAMNAVRPSATGAQCFADLSAAEVRFTPLPDKSFDGGCKIIDTVKLMDFGTPTTNLGAMTCPLAKNFTAWARYAVRPAAKKILGSDVVKIETMGTYSCRNIYGGRSGRLSQHAFANAIDVSAFVLADGRRISLQSNWHGDKRGEEFLRAIRKSACRRFGTVLSPDYNSAHYNHFHLDMSGKDYCR